MCPPAACFVQRLLKIKLVYGFLAEYKNTHNYLHGAEAFLKS
jgi:hypothetical protein